MRGLAAPPDKEGFVETRSFQSWTEWLLCSGQAAALIILTALCPLGSLAYHNRPQSRSTNSLHGFLQKETHEGTLKVPFAIEQVSDERR